MESGTKAVSSPGPLPIEILPNVKSGDTDREQDGSPRGARLNGSGRPSRNDAARPRRRSAIDPSSEFVPLTRNGGGAAKDAGVVEAAIPGIRPPEPAQPDADREDPAGTCGRFVPPPAAAAWGVGSARRT